MGSSPFRIAFALTFLAGTFPVEARVGLRLKCVARAFVRQISQNPEVARINEITDPIVKRWVYEVFPKLELGRVEERLGRKFRHRGETLIVSGRAYPILAPLGMGSEGAVYLVKTPQGLRAVKEIREREVKGSLASHIQTWESAAKRKGYSVPKVFAVDETHRTVLMEYWEGVPYRAIEFDWRELGIDENQAARLRARYDEVLEPWNAIYSFSKDRLFVIDAF